MTKNIYFILFAIGILWTVSCKKQQDHPIIPSEGKYENGGFIINEGNFGMGNGSISYIDTKKHVVTPDIFRAENNHALGDVVQSMQIIGGKAYIAVNNSNKIEIVDYSTFKELGVIADMPLVRYIVRTDPTTACASIWGNHGQIVYFNTNTYEVIKTVDVGNGPEGMIQVDHHLFVANCGGLQVDHTISVIDNMTKDVIKTIEVGFSPKQFVRDAHGMLWVLCSGTGSWSSVGIKPSSLVQIDPVDLTVVQEISLFDDLQIGNIGIDPTSTVLVVGGGYGVGALYKVSITQPATPTETFITGNFYGFSIDGSTGDIFTADAGNYSNQGSIHQYSFSGEKIQDYQAGIIPNSVYFSLPSAIEK